MKKLGLLAVLTAIATVYVLVGKEAAGPRIASQLRVGMELSSRLELEDKASLQFGSSGNSQGSGFKQYVHSILKADLNETILKEEGGTLRSFLLLSNIDLKLDLGETQAEAMRERILTDLGRGAWIVRDPAGTVLDVRVPAGTDDAAREFLVLVAQSTQYSLPEGQSAEWEAEESDRNGSYNALYKATEKDGDVWTIEKSRGPYLKYALNLDSNIGRQSVSGKGSGHKELRFDEEKQQILSIIGEETLELFDANSRKIGFHTQRLDWKRMVRKALVKEALSQSTEAFQDAPSMEDARRDFQKRQDQAMYEQRLGGLGLLDLQSFYANPDDSDQAMTEHWLKLRAYVYLHPEAMPALMEDLKARSPKDPFFANMISALVSISSPEAQKVLVDLTLARRGEEGAMEALVPQLGFVSAPEAIVSDALRTLKQDEATRGMANLAFGTMGSQLAKVDGEAARERLREIENEILADVSSAQQPKALAHQMDVIGNFASADTLPVIEMALQHEDAKVRENAVYALRDIEGSEAQGFLRKSLEDEKEKAVRNAAAHALANARPSQDTLDLAQHILENEADHEIRLALLPAVEKARYVNADLVKQILQERRTQDAHEDVRKSAELLLTQFESEDME